MECFALGEMVPQGAVERMRQESHAVLLSLSIPNRDFPAAEIEVFDPQLTALEQPKP